MKLSIHRLWRPRQHLTKLACLPVQDVHAGTDHGRGDGQPGAHPAHLGPSVGGAVGAPGLRGVPSRSPGRRPGHRPHARARREAALTRRAVLLHPPGANMFWWLRHFCECSSPSVHVLHCACLTAAIVSTARPEACQDFARYKASCYRWINVSSLAINAKAGLIPHIRPVPEVQAHSAGCRPLYLMTVHACGAGGSFKFWMIASPCFTDAHACACRMRRCGHSWQCCGMRTARSCGR